MRLVKGRWITEADPPDATVINETMAQRAFGAADPIGQSIDRLGREIRVVGVGANLKYSKLDADPGPEIFRAYPQNLGPGRVTITVAVRVDGDPLGIAPAARKMISNIDPTQPIYKHNIHRDFAEGIVPLDCSPPLQSIPAGDVRCWWRWSASTA